MANKQQIEKVMEMFSSATGLTAVYVDIDGKEISDDDQFPPVCQIMRQVPHLRKHCQKCAKCGGFETMKNGQPCIYRCHAGLADFAVPVKSRENTLYGFIISGQVRLEDDENQVKEFLQQKPLDLSSRHDFAAAYSKLPVFSLEKLSASAEVLSTLSAYYLPSILNEEEAKPAKEPADQAKKHARSKKEIKQALKYIQKHIHQPVTLEEVAGHVYLSPYYFSKLFKKETGETFVSFVNRQKMNLAKDMLANDDLPVSYIAHSLGFREISYFSKVFKRYYQTTPTSYRAMSRKKG